MFHSLWSKTKCSCLEKKSGLHINMLKLRTIGSALACFHTCLPVFTPVLARKKSIAGNEQYSSKNLPKQTRDYRLHSVVQRSVVHPAVGQKVQHREASEMKTVFHLPITVVLQVVFYASIHFSLLSLLWAAPLASYFPHSGKGRTEVRGPSSDPSHAQLGRNCWT